MRTRPVSQLAPRTALVMAMLGLSQIASSARAEQFVLIDSTFTFTKEMADSGKSPSHYYGSVLNAERPVDWTSPIDYRNGSVHIRTEVIDKPAGSEITQWVICYIGDGAYGCTGSGTYTEEGVYERDESMTEWWQNETIDWTKGIEEMHLVLKDQDDASGFASLREDWEQFFPTTVRITMIQVAAGSEYDDSMFPADDGEGDDDMGEVDAGAATMDASTPSDDGDGETPADEDGSDDMTGNSGNGNGNGTGGSDHDEGAPESSGEESSGCSVGTMGQAASPHVGVMALGLSALIARARRRKRTPTS